MKKLFYVITLCILVAGCSQDSLIEKPAPPPDGSGYYAEETVNLVYVYQEVFPEAPDKERVIDRLNEMTKEKINVTVTVEPYSHVNIESKIKFKLASKLQIDIFSNNRAFVPLAAGNALAPLDDLLMQYGHDMLDNGKQFDEI